MPAVGQGEGKLCPRTATAGDLAIRSRYFRSKMSLLSGSHPQNITFATPMSCPIPNFAKGSKALPQEQRWNGKQRIKVDIQIIAIACVQNVEVIYSNDQHFKTIVEQAEVDIRVENVDDILRKYS